MKLIITCTHRKNSLSLELAHVVLKNYKNLGEHSAEILDLQKVPFQEMIETPYSLIKPSPSLKKHLLKIAQAEALILVCPEYNGGMPGLIKHFIDHWIYPDSFVYKPVCFIGLGGKFGALTPIKQLESVFIYRHSFVFPLRVLVQNVHQVLKNREIQDDNIKSLLEKQTKNFIKFTKALKTENFD